MKHVYPFGVILALACLGEALGRLLPFPIPASVYGVVLLFLALHFRWLDAERLREASRFFIEILPVLFIPAAVGLMESWELIRADWPAYLAIIAVSTFLVFGAGGVVTEWFLRRERGGGR